MSCVLEHLYYWVVCISLLVYICTCGILFLCLCTSVFVHLCTCVFLYLRNCKRLFLCNHVLVHMWTCGLVYLYSYVLLYLCIFVYLSSCVLLIFHGGCNFATLISFVSYCGQLLAPVEGFGWGRGCFWPSGKKGLIMLFWLILGHFCVQ